MGNLLFLESVLKYKLHTPFLHAGFKNRYVYKYKLIVKQICDNISLKLVCEENVADLEFPIMYYVKPSSFGYECKKSTLL